jgi:predicted O-methyltransferase YrrM
VDNDIDRSLSALATNPSNPDLINNVGVAFHRKGDLSSALSYFAKAINASPQHILATRNHQIVMEQLGITGKLFTNRFMMYYFQGKHYYTPLPEEHYVYTHSDTLFDLSRDLYQGIDINEPHQLDLIHDLSTFHGDLPFLGEKERGRYQRVNYQFGEADAAILYCMMRLKKPKRVIEIGSGFSSAIMLDANDDLERSGNRVRFIFVDPDCSRLKPLLRSGDGDALIIEDLVQNVDTEIFKMLDAGDILFIDSSHVIKVGSDVNFLIGTVLPLLNHGVIIHFHDIFHNFEYPRIWFEIGYPWNEAYSLKHFLMYNNAFEIILFNSFMMHRHSDFIFDRMPIIKSLWDSGRWIEKSWGRDRQNVEKAWMTASLWLIKNNEARSAESTNGGDQ